MPTSLLPIGRIYLPPIQDGESLYSWCAHYHVLSSNSRPEQTSRQLFGHPHAGRQPAFPVRLSHLADRAEGCLGSPESIIFERTPFGIFARFLEQTRIETIVDSMKTGRPMRVARALGLDTSRYGPPAPLKACPSCFTAERKSSKVSRWHTEHQIPGVLICSRHDCLLLVATDEAHARARNEFLQPHSLSDTEWRPNPLMQFSDMDTLRSLAQWATTLSNHGTQPETPFDRSALRDTCHLQAQKKGWIAIDGTLRFKQIREAILASHTRLAKLPTLHFIESAEREAGGFVGLLLRKFESFHHPLMHLVLLSFLFDSPEAYESAYSENLQRSSNNRRRPLTAERDAIRQKVSECVGSRGQSVNNTAQVLGINVQRALIYLRESGVSYKPRPRIIGTSKEASLVERLQRGDEPGEIARVLSIRRGYIKDYLAARPELRRDFEQAAWSRRKEAYRSKFLRALADNPSLPIKRIRRETNSGFEWLYRNDRQWLEDALPGIWRRSSAGT